MGLDRFQPEYRAVEVLLDEYLQTVLDDLVDQSRDTEDLLELIECTSASHSQKARLRLAMWFWNGDIDIRKDDVLCLDPQNLGRFLRAMGAVQ